MFFHPQTPLACRLTRHVHSELSRTGRPLVPKNWVWLIGSGLMGIYSRLDLITGELLSTVPFLSMIFFSTTFSPGSGVSGVKELRYLFPRFYFYGV